MPIQIAEVVRADLDALACFLSREILNLRKSDEGEPTNAEMLAWLLFENPAADDHLPVGWVARTPAGRIVGTLLCVWQRFRYRKVLYRLPVCSCFFVARGYRGIIGLMLFQRYKALGKRYVLFGTPNENSRPIFACFGARPVPNTDHMLLGVLNWAPLIEEWLLPRLKVSGLAYLMARASARVPSLLRHELQASPGKSRLARLSSSAEVERLHLEAAYAGSSALSTQRDRAFLRWRYFAGRHPRPTLYEFLGHDGARSLVAVQQRFRGHRKQIRRLDILDFWGCDCDSCTRALVGELCRLYADSTDVIVFQGQPPKRQRCLREAGFLRHRFDGPSGYYLDAHRHLPTRDWYWVPADGDAAIW